MAIKHCKRLKEYIYIYIYMTRNFFLKNCKFISKNAIFIYFLVKRKITRIYTINLKLHCLKIKLIFHACDVRMDILISISLPGFDGLLEAQKVRASLSLLHSEIEALI